MSEIQIYRVLTAAIALFTGSLNHVIAPARGQDQ